MEDVVVPSKRKGSGKLLWASARDKAVKKALGRRMPLDPFRDTSPKLDQGQRGTIPHVSVYLRRARGLRTNGSSIDPYVKLYCAGSVQSSQCAARTRDPEWDQVFTFAVTKPESAVLRLKVKNDRVWWRKNDLVGVCEITLADVMKDPARYGESAWVALEGRNHVEAGEVELQIYFSEGAPLGDLKVLCCTWNVGNAAPPVDLSPWLRGCAEGAHHLVAVAAQECSFGAGATVPTMWRAKSNTRNDIMEGEYSEIGPPAAAHATPLPSLGPLQRPALSLGTVQRPPPLSLGPAQRPPVLLIARRDVPSAPPDQQPGEHKANGAVWGRTVSLTRAMVANGAQAPELGPLVTHRSEPLAAALPAPSPSGLLATSPSVNALDLEPSRATTARRERRQLNYYKMKSTGAQLRRVVDVVDSGREWEELVCDSIGERYWLVGRQQMGHIRLLVFARVDMVPCVTHVRSDFEATGVGGVGLNKGGVAVALRVGHSELCFVNSHLAAHQSKVAHRNSDFREIVGQLPLASYGMDLVTAYHHVFWMGDLNYRVDFRAGGGMSQPSSRTDLAKDFSSALSGPGPGHGLALGPGSAQGPAPGLALASGASAYSDMQGSASGHDLSEAAEDTPSNNDWAAMVHLVNQHRYAELLVHDQLKRTISSGEAFTGFIEGNINFAPTFKVVRGEEAAGPRLDAGQAFSSREQFAAIYSVMAGGAPPPGAGPTPPGGGADGAQAVPTYVRKRLPAWTDRVLVRSNLPHRHARVESYYSAPRLSSSDHKPVGSVFSVPMVEHTVVDQRHPSNMQFVLELTSVQTSSPGAWPRLAPEHRRALLSAASPALASGKGRSTVPLALGGAGVSSDGGGEKRSRAAAAAGGGGWPQGVELLSCPLKATLLPGAPENLKDDRLMLRVVVRTTLKGSTTLARGVLPLQPLVNDFLLSGGQDATRVTVSMQKDGRIVDLVEVTGKLRMVRGKFQHSRSLMNHAFTSLRSRTVDRRSFSATPRSSRPNSLQQTDSFKQQRGEVPATSLPSPVASAALAALAERKGSMSSTRILPPLGAAAAQRSPAGAVPVTAGREWREG